MNGYSEDMSAVDESSFERLVNIQSYTDDELRTLANSLAEEETALSKKRRMLQAELDIVRAELVRRLRDSGEAARGIVVDGDVAVLAEILAKSGPGNDAPDN